MEQNWTINRTRLWNNFMGTINRAQSPCENQEWSMFSDQIRVQRKKIVGLEILIQILLLFLQQLQCNITFVVPTISVPVTLQLCFRYRNNFSFKNNTVTMIRKVGGTWNPLKTFEDERFFFYSGNADVAVLKHTYIRGIQTKAGKTNDAVNFGFRSVATIN